MIPLPPAPPLCHPGCWAPNLLALVTTEGFCRVRRLASGIALAPRAELQPPCRPWRRVETTCDRAAAKRLAVIAKRGHSAGYSSVQDIYENRILIFFFIVSFPNFCLPGSLSGDSTWVLSLCFSRVEESSIKCLGSGPLTDVAFRIPPLGDRWQWRAALFKQTCCLCRCCLREGTARAHTPSPALASTLVCMWMFEEGKVQCVSPGFVIIYWLRVAVTHPRPETLGQVDSR